MGYVSTVVSALQDAGIRAEAAYPGRQMPAITEAVAAVCLERADYGTGETVVLVTVFSPGSKDGILCETAAEKAGAALASLGSGCVQGKCQYSDHEDLYYGEIRVTFAPEPEPEADPIVDFSVSQDGTALPFTVSFIAKQEADADNGISLADAAWTIQLEEEFEPGETETVNTADSFTLTVTRHSSTEVYSGCAWVSVHRENGLDKLRQVRTGTAGSRSYTAK